MANYNTPYSGTLKEKIQRWFQNPKKTLSPYIKESGIINASIRSGMRVVDFGCGMGYFTFELAHCVGDKGSVYAVDLQKEMLKCIAQKSQSLGLQNRITQYQYGYDPIPIHNDIDLFLAFYSAHEIPDQKSFFYDACSMLKPKGKFLLIEPRFHVSRAVFQKTLLVATECGLRVVEEPKVFFSRTAILQKDEA